MEPLTDSEEAFRQWRDAMRAMARLPQGIPSQFRRRIWLTLASHHLTHSQHLNWPRLVRIAFSPAAAADDEVLTRQIDKDLHRTG